MEGRERKRDEEVERKDNPNTNFWIRHCSSHLI